MDRFVHYNKDGSVRCANRQFIYITVPVTLTFLPVDEYFAGASNHYDCEICCLQIMFDQLAVWQSLTTTLCLISTNIANIFPLGIHLFILKCIVT